MLCGSLPTDPSDASWLLWIETWGETRRLPSLREVMADLTEHEIEVIHRLFAEGADAGEFVCADPVAAAARLSALRDGLAIQQTLFGVDQSPDQTPERFIEEFRGGICHELGLHACRVRPARGDRRRDGHSARVDRTQFAPRLAPLLALSAGAIWSFGTVLARVADGPTPSST